MIRGGGHDAEEHHIKITVAKIRKKQGHLIYITFQCQKYNEKLYINTEHSNKKFNIPVCYAFERILREKCYFLIQL